MFQDTLMVMCAPGPLSVNVTDLVGTYRPVRLGECVDDALEIFPVLTLEE